MASAVATSPSFVLVQKSGEFSHELVIVIQRGAFVMGLLVSLFVMGL
jgi:hypothetical protein